MLDFSDRTRTGIIYYANFIDLFRYCDQLASKKMDEYLVELFKLSEIGEVTIVKNPELEKTEMELVISSPSLDEDIYNAAKKVFRASGLFNCSGRMWSRDWGSKLFRIYGKGNTHFMANPQLFIISAFRTSEAQGIIHF